MSNGNILSGALNSDIKLWEGFCHKKSFKGHTKPVRDFCQIDDEHFASGSFDNTIKIWNINNSETFEQELKGHTSNVINVIKLKDNTLVSCSTDKTIIVWK